MKKQTIIILVVMFLCFPTSVTAQDEAQPLVLSLTKEFGYAAAGQVQGSFSLKVRLPDDLIRVDFFIDGQLVHSDTQPPFQFNFNTIDYDYGEHTFSAVGFRADNSMLFSSEISRKFISAEDAWKNVGKLLVPVFIVIGIVALLGASGGALLIGGKNFKLGQYGVFGGAVCPKCQLPFTRNILAPNLAVGKLQRCPHCGKWSVVPRASAQDLMKAERRYQNQGDAGVGLIDQETQYKELLDDSRFER